MLYKILCCVALTALWAVPADADHCPDETPFHRGDVCASCDWQEVVRQYQADELSTTRPSRLFDHEIRVSVFCDANRPVDIEDVFEKLAATEAEFDATFGRAIDPIDGINPGEGIDAEASPHVLEVVVGICDYDYGAGVDDCTMYMLCTEEWGWRCSPGSGQAFRNTPNDATHTAFVPYFPEGSFWWTEGNRYGNLQHEFTHLLDYTYLRVDNGRGPDTRWWVEGLAQYIQWRQLNDRLSWNRGNDEATLLGVLTNHQETNEYYDGMRVFAYLTENAPWLLERAANAVRTGVYVSPDQHLDWHNLLGYAAWWHQRQWADWIERRTGDVAPSATVTSELPGPLENHGP